MVLKSPLHHIHEKLDANFMEFGGYEMPLQFSSIREEHLAVRKNVGLFDVSHMCNVIIRGEEAEQLLTLTTAGNVPSVAENKGQYTVLLREDGSIIDDTIFFHLPDDTYFMIPNAGNGKKITEWLNTQAQQHDISAEAANVSQEYVILAVQGPKSRETMENITDADLSSMKMFDCTYTPVSEKESLLSHTGYTGELGFELQVTPTENAEGIFNQILEAGKTFDIKPVGLGARDTLRLEKCFALAGNEFKGGKTPLQANLSWLIHWDHDFIGKEALQQQKEEGGYEKLTCLKCTERGIPRHGCEVHKNGERVGTVSSGTLSPCLNTGIAMAYVQPDYREIGDHLDIIIRKKNVPAEIVKPPFIPKDWAEKED